MKNKVQISNIQTALLCFVIIAGTQILFLPNTLASISKQDSWIGAILGVLIGLVIVYIYILFLRHFPNTSFSDLNERIYGKFFGRFISVVYYFYFFMVAVIMVRFFNEFASISSFVQTPIIVFHIFFASIVIYGAWLGIETFSRALKLFFPFIAILLFVLTLFSLPNLRIDHFLPMFEYGVKPIAYSAISYQFLTTVQVVVLLVIFSTFQPPKIDRAIILGTTFSGLILIIITVLSIGVLGAEIVNLRNYPTYYLAKNIYIGDFITRIEVFIVWMWFLTIYFKVTIFFYATSVGIAQTFQLSNYRLLLLPFGIMLVVLADTVYPSIVHFEVLLPYWSSFSVTMGFFLPLLMLIIAKIRKLY